MTHHTVRAHHERGALPFGIIIGVAIVGALIFVGIQLIPLYWDHLNFKNDAEASVKLVFVRHNREHEKELLREITKGLDEIGAIYEKKNVRVKVDEKKKFASMEVWYALPHKVPFLQNPMQFHIQFENTAQM